MAARVASREKKDARRIREILSRLAEEYAGAECALDHENAFQLLVATILSAQCTDVRVNMVTPELFRRYPTPEALAAADEEELQEIIRSTGFFRNKARNLRGAAARLVEEFGGEVPRTMEEMLQLPGVARKTANVVLGTAYGIASGVVVDTHVSRISRRLGLTEQETPEKIEADLCQVVPKRQWIDFAHQVIHHGRALCKARKPLCEDCFLTDLCPHYWEASADA